MALAGGIAIGLGAALFGGKVIDSVFTATRDDESDQLITFPTAVVLSGTALTGILVFDRVRRRR